MQVNEPFPKKTLEEAKASYEDTATEFRSFVSSIQHKNRGLNRKVEAIVRNYFEIICLKTLLRLSTPPLRKMM